MPKDEVTYYKQANRRQCYWLVQECLKGKSPCSFSCPGYLSVAQAKSKQRDMEEGEYHGQDFCRRQS